MPKPQDSTPSSRPYIANIVQPIPTKVYNDGNFAGYTYNNLIVDPDTGKRYIAYFQPKGDHLTELYRLPMEDPKDFPTKHFDIVGGNGKVYVGKIPGLRADVLDLVGQVGDAMESFGLPPFAPQPHTLSKQLAPLRRDYVDKYGREYYVPLGYSRGITDENIRQYNRDMAATKVGLLSVLTAPLSIYGGGVGTGLMAARLAGTRLAGTFAGNLLTAGGGAAGNFLGNLLGQGAVNGMYAMADPIGYAAYKDDLEDLAKTEPLKLAAAESFGTLAAGMGAKPTIDLAGRTISGAVAGLGEAVNSKIQGRELNSTVIAGQFGLNFLTHSKGGPFEEAVTDAGNVTGKYLARNTVPFLQRAGRNLFAFPRAWNKAVLAGVEIGVTHLLLA